MTVCAQIMERSEDAVVARVEVRYNHMVEDMASQTNDVGGVERMIPRDAATGDNTVIPTGIARTQASNMKTPQKNTRSTQHVYMLDGNMDVCS